MNQAKLDSLLNCLKGLDKNGHLYFYDYSHREGYPFCSSASIETESGVLKGWGYGKTRAEANFLSLAELYERYLMSIVSPSVYTKGCFFSGKPVVVSQCSRIGKQKVVQTSNGCAVHGSLNKSRVAALSEAIERHVILKATVEKIPPLKIKEKEVCLAVRPFFFDERVNIFQWKGPLGFYVSVSAIKIDKGFMYGFGCSKKRRESIRKAYIESCGSLLADFDIKPPRDLQFGQVDPEYVMEYHILGKSNRLPGLMHSSANDLPSVGPFLRKKEVFFSSFKCASLGRSSLPWMWFTRAISPKLQPLFYDYWDEKFLNKDAIPKFDRSLVGDLHVIS